MHQSINQKLSEKRQQQLHEPRVVLTVSGKPSVVTEDKEGLTVCTLDPIDNVVEVASDTFFEDESTERDFDGAGEVSIAVGMLLDVGSD